MHFVNYGIYKWIVFINELYIIECLIVEETESDQAYDPTPVIVGVVVGVGVPLIICGIIIAVCCIKKVSVFYIIRK